MFFSELLGPKWKSRRPEVRTAAAAALDPVRDRDVLRSLAISDPEPVVRLAAWRQLRDIDLLREQLTRESAVAVVTFLREQLAVALCGDPAWSWPLGERITWLADADMSLIARVLRDGREAELRQAALSRLDAPEALSELVLGEAPVEFRLAALARIEAPDLLERIAREARQRDKRIAKEAKARLEALRGPQRDREQLIEALRRACGELEALQVESVPERLMAALAELTPRWQELESRLDEGLRRRLPEDLPGRGQRALAKAERRLQSLREAAETARREAEARGERERLCQAAERLRSELRHQASDSCAEPELVRGLLDTLLNNWRHAQPASSLEEARFEARFREAVSACERALLELAQVPAIRSQAEALVTAIESLAQTLEQQADLAGVETELKPLTRAWSQLPSLREVGLPAEFKARFEAARQAILERIEVARAAERAASADARKQLKRLEALLNAGRTRVVARLLNDFEQSVQTLPEASAIPLRKRFAELMERVQELRDWQVWAALPRKEAACEAMEALAAQPLAGPEHARQLKALQQLWRSLGPTTAEQDAEFKARFEAAAERAAEPIRSYQAEQQAMFERHRVAREALCQEAEAALEAFRAGTEPDYKALRKQLASLRQRWSEAGHLPQESWQALQQRFRAPVDALSSALQAEERRNVEAREGILAEAEQLAMSPLEQAIPGLKALQARWAALGAGIPKRDQVLWQRFRALCDQVFAARQEQFDTRRAAQNAQVEAWEALLKDWEQAQSAELGDADRQALEVRREALERLPSGQQAAFDKRWREAQAQRDARRRQRQSAERAERLQQFLSKAAVCSDWELGRIDGDQANARWAGLPVLPEPLESALAGRWAALQAGVSDEKARVTAAALRAELALRAEIIAGVDSPAELRATRMRMQVERLAGHLRDGSDHGGDREQLLRDWHAAGPMSPDQLGLELRFNQALDARDVRQNQS